MPHQLALTVWARVRAGQAGALDELLRAGSPIPFARLPATHFGRLLLLEDGGATPVLLLGLDVDAPFEAPLDELVDVAGDCLDRVFRHCEGYPEAGVADRAGRMAYLRSHLTDVAVFYAHFAGRTLDQVRGESELRVAIERFLDRAPAWRGRSALEVREAIREHVAGDPSLSWALGPPAAPELGFRVREAAHMIAVPALLVLLLPVLVPAALVWLAWLRLHELNDPPPDVSLDPNRLRQLREEEDLGPQNQISTLAEVKPGAFWHLTAWLFMGVANYSARHVFTRSSLAGLRTVHFARFMRFGRPRRVLFTSYYDGSLESYMNDFIDKVAWVLNGVFGSQSGYPRTRWLFGAGARDETGFKAFLRGRQIPTQVWYSAYPGLTAVNVDDNARLRAGLRGAMSETEAEAWLHLL
ncbi:MAG TPA: hypothetical protein VGO86_07670 [Candidatus Dormibacteraeota bacterium]